MKNLLLSSALLLTSFGALAQLFVRPNPSTNADSYVYVKNQLLYVKNDINLEINNPTGDAVASIYLREGGQLIQGGTSSINKGNGFLSAQQKAVGTNAFAYNYWCSPVGNPEAGFGNPPVLIGSGEDGNKNFGVGGLYEDKNTPLGEGTKARLADHVPGRDGYTNPNLTISTRWLSYLKTPGQEAYANYVRVNAADDVQPGYGFTMKGTSTGGLPVPTDPGVGSHDQTYEFRGRPNNGDFTIPVAGPAEIFRDPTAEPSPALETAMMVLSGNPYPSALDLNKFFYNNTNRLNAIYFYDEDRDAMSHFYNAKPYGYGVWVPGGQDPYTLGVPNPVTYPGYYVAASFFIWNANGDRGSSEGTGSGSQKKRFAPIGQGFMLVGKSSGNVTIRNNQRIFEKEGANSEFQRPVGDQEDLIASNGNGEANRTSAALSSGVVVDTRTPQLRLNVIFDGQLSRELLLVLSPQASDGYDAGFDGLSPMGMKSEAFFPIGPDSQTYPYVIQGTNYEPRKMVPITFILHKTSQIEVRAIEEIRKPYQKAYLFDRHENIYRPLLNLRNAASSFTLPAGDYVNRFFIVFRASSDNPRPDGNLDMMDAQTKVMADVGMFQNNPAQQFEIRNPEGYILKAAYMYDMSGKLVIADNNLGDSSNYSFYTGNLSDGVYLVKLVTSDDIVIDYKALVMNR